MTWFGQGGGALPLTSDAAQSVGCGIIGSNMVDPFEGSLSDLLAAYLHEPSHPIPETQPRLLGFIQRSNVGLLITDVEIAEVSSGG